MEVRKIMTTSFYRSHTCTATLNAPNPVAGHLGPVPLLETPGNSQKSGSVPCGGHCSFSLGPGEHKILFVPSNSLFPSSVYVMAALWWG